MVLINNPRIWIITNITECILIYELHKNIENDKYNLTDILRNFILEEFKLILENKIEVCR